jgi:WD40 repeat protein
MKNIIATGSFDRTAKVWLLNSDWSEASCFATLEGHGSYVNSVAFHPTMFYLVTGSSDSTAKLWQFNAAKCVATLQGHSSSVNSVAFHPTLPFLATGSCDKTAKLWSFNLDRRTVSCVATLQGHNASVNSVAFHRYFPVLATGSSDKTAKLWRFNPDGSAPSCIVTLEGHTLEGHSGPIFSVAFHPTAIRILATCSLDCTTKFWNLNHNSNTASCVATIKVQDDPFSSIAFSTSMPILSTLDYDNRIKLWLLNSEGIVVDSTKENIEEFIQQNNNQQNNNQQNAGSLQNESRFFKLVSVNGKEVDGGRYELPSKTKSGKAQTRGPKDKASFAFSEICKKNSKKGECSYKFAIQETTRGSNKKVYHYEGKRVKLTKPIVLELKDKKTGKVKKVVKKYKNIIVATH